MIITNEMYEQYKADMAALNKIPFSLEELRIVLETGHITEDDMIWAKQVLAQNG